MFPLRPSPTPVGRSVSSSQPHTPPSGTYAMRPRVTCYYGRVYNNDQSTVTTLILSNPRKQGKSSCWTTSPLSIHDHDAAAPSQPAEPVPLRPAGGTAYARARRSSIPFAARRKTATERLPRPRPCSPSRGERTAPSPCRCRLGAGSIAYERACRRQAAAAELRRRQPAAAQALHPACQRHRGRYAHELGHMHISICTHARHATTRSAARAHCA